MTNLQSFLLRLQNNLNILNERAAKHGDNAPLDLLNQIEDHQQAIALTEQAIAGELTEAKWLEELQPLLLPFWQGLSSSVLAVLIEAAQTGAPPASIAALQETTLAHLRQTPKSQLLADEFVADPDTYQKPVQKELAHSLQSDAEFAARLHGLLAQIEADQLEGGDTYTATITGTGSIAQGPGATATTATDGGIAIGSVGGDLNIGGNNNE